MPDKNQYVGSDRISSDCFRGTREQWKKFLLATPWYADFCQELELGLESTTEIPTEDAWVEDLLDSELTPWDGDTDYQPIGNV